MRHPEKNKAVHIIVMAAFVALVGITELLYGQENRARSKNYAGSTSIADKDGTAAHIGPVERDDPWSAEEIVQPDALAKSLAGANKPFVLQVGIVHLYRLGHIPGSKYAGPANSAEGLDMLKKAVQILPRTSEIVYYCGCCPWKDCPNIRPAHTTLKEMGFKKVHVLNLPNNFSEDWAAKGLPTEKGGA